LPNSGASPTPSECLARGVDRSINRSRPCFRDARDNGSIGGIHIVEETVPADKLPVHKVSQLWNDGGAGRPGSWRYSVFNRHRQFAFYPFAMPAPGAVPFRGVGIATFCGLHQTKSAGASVHVVIFPALTKPEALQLSRGCFRQFGVKLDMMRSLETRQATFDKGLQFARQRAV